MDHNEIEFACNILIQMRVIQERVSISDCGTINTCGTISACGTVGDLDSTIHNTRYATKHLSKKLIDVPRVKGRFSKGGGTSPSRRLFPPRAEKKVMQWIETHSRALYPTEDDICYFIELASQEGEEITPKQVRTFFANCRRKGKGARRPFRTPPPFGGIE
jgi:hypothetical protein